MPRRRGRRLPALPSGGTPEGPAVRSVEIPTAGATSARGRLCPLLFLVVIALLVCFFLSFRPNRDAAAAGDASASVFARGLVKPKITYRDVLSEHSRISSDEYVRHFPNPVLAYITPWNSLGYEMAERFASRFTHVSPVWYELKSEEKKFSLEGRHNADTGWISRIRSMGKALVIPRVVLEASPSEMLKKKRRETVTRLIVTECMEMGYDGIVLESWSRWAMYGVLHDLDMRKKALVFIKELAMALHSVNSSTNPRAHLELIYVIPAPRTQDLKEHDFGPEDLQELSGAVDGFSLMTYDFSGPQNPGPNAPVLWIRACLELLLRGKGRSERSNPNKIFLGINFYGNDFVLTEGGLDGGAITGKDFLALLQKHKPEFRWENRSAEHFFVYSRDGAKHVVFYPSLLSVSTRIDEARAWGTGLSIWEIGQGLEYFFDLL